MVMLLFLPSSSSSRLDLSYLLSPRCVRLSFFLLLVSGHHHYQTSFRLLLLLFFHISNDHASLVILLLLLLLYFRCCHCSIIHQCPFVSSLSLSLCDCFVRLFDGVRLDGRTPCVTRACAFFLDALPSFLPSLSPDSTPIIPNNHLSPDEAS